MTNRQIDIPYTLNEIFKESGYADVTLDGLESFQVHKLVLSACSSVMKEIFLRNPHEKPWKGLMLQEQ